MAKPDDRSNNAERIKNTIGHTLQNMNETRDFAKAHSEELSEEEMHQIEEKNQRREESIDGMREEIKDEVSDQKNIREVAWKRMKNASMPKKLRPCERNFTNLACKIDRFFHILYIALLSLTFIPKGGICVFSKNVFYQ